MASGRADPPVATLDGALLEQFLTEMRDAGFAPDDARRAWTGPLPAELHELTSDTTMTVVLNDGWPYQPPSVRVAGLRSWHANEGLLCLWQSGDNTRDWATFGGIRARITHWAADAKDGFKRFGRALDPHLYWEGRDATVALIDVDDLLRRDRQDGHHGIFHVRVSQDLWLVGREKGRGGDVINGRFFYRSSVPFPPRNVEDLAAALTPGQSRRFLKDLDDVQPGCEWLTALFWEVEEGTVPLVLRASRSGTGGLSVTAVAPAPCGEADLLRRAGPDASVLEGKRVVVFGVGAIGSHLASLLARSGVGGMRLVDADRLWPSGVVRHAADPRTVTLPKPHAMKETLAPKGWTGVEPIAEGSWDPERLAALMDAADLVVESTGFGGFAELVARVAAREDRPLVSVALYRGGAIARVRRQASGDTRLWERGEHWRYPGIPPGTDEEAFVGYEAGCAAPIHNAPPVAVVRAAAAAAAACVDELTGRREHRDEVVEVYRAIEPPLDRHGTLVVPRVAPRVDVAESAAGALRVAARRAAPNETGGVLIGRLVQGVPVVTAAIELPSASPTPTGYRVEEGATVDVVEAAVVDDPSSGYVGEWHTHPSDQPASTTDRDAMSALVTADGTGDPVLIVVRPRDGKHVLDGYVASAVDVHTVPVMIVGDVAGREHEG